MCMNDDCDFYRLSPNGQWNTNSWVRKSGRAVRVCFMCGQYAMMVKCTARKLVEYDDEKETAWVYHIGKHIHVHDETRNEEVVQNNQESTGRYKRKSRPKRDAEMNDMTESGQVGCGRC